MSGKRKSVTAGRALACALAWLVACTAAADDDAPAAKAAIRRVESRHLVLDTDLPPGDEIDALPALFDQAFPQWCDYFGINVTKDADWRVHGCLMRAPERFRAAGLLPADVAEFNSGYTRGGDFWLRDQASPYYRRHLLLHEGTHAFMYTLVGDNAPPWYFEGIAELLATHRLMDGHLTLNSFPHSSDEVQKWGRIEMVQAALTAGRSKTLNEIFAYDSGAHFRNEPYAWCWAAAAFLDGSPRYQSAFRKLAAEAGEPDFAQRAARALAADPQIAEHWQTFIATLDYGYDFRRMQIDAKPAEPLAGDKAHVEVAADRGWQSSGIELPAGKYRLSARGRYQIANLPRVWFCEPGGVTIRYYRGRPLGMLLAAIRPAEASHGAGPLKPLAVGLGTTLELERAAVLYFRINDAPGSLADNGGSLDVAIARE